MITRNMYDKVVLFTVLEYLGKQLDSKDQTYQEEEMKIIHGKLDTYRRTHLFSPKQVAELREIGAKPAFEKVKGMPVDYSIYAIELLALWVKGTSKRDRSKIFYSDDKVMRLKSTMVMDMLRMNARDPEVATRIRGIITDSRLVAKIFINLLDNEVKE